MTAEAAPADDPILGAMFILTVDTGFAKYPSPLPTWGPSLGCAWLTDSQRAVLARSCVLCLCASSHRQGAEAV